jgi:hypothetical protein
MYEHIHKAENLIKQEFHDQADLALPEKSICAEIAVVKRMPIERE